MWAQAGAVEHNVLNLRRGGKARKAPNTTEPTVGTGGEQNKRIRSIPPEAEEDVISAARQARRREGAGDFSAPTSSKKERLLYGVFF